MRKLLSISLLALAATAGCAKSKSDPADNQSQPVAAKAAVDEAAEAKVATVTVDELDQMLAKNDCQAVDANGDATRKKMGVIPGAVLLDDSDSIDKLPGDKAKNLVFYCANTACGASHHAAAKAITAGYTNVKVLPDGIAGWVKAGKKTSSI